MSLDGSLRMQDFKNIGSASVHKAVAQLDAALGRLELVCASSRDRAEQLCLEQEQRSDQHIQSLRVQSDHWRGEAERQASTLTQLRAHENNGRDKMADLEVDLAQWRQRSQQWQEKAEQQASELVALRGRENKDRDKIVDLESDLAQWRQRSQQWQEKVESWKEEARRSEEARVAALHRVGSAEVKALASEVGATIDNAINHVRAVLNRKKLKAEI